jgi:hypothetical protein
MTNTLSAAGHIPCPAMDKERMRILTHYAIRANFGWPRPSPAVLDFDSESVLHAFSKETDSFLNGKLQIGLKIVGPGGGDWTIRFVPSSGNKGEIHTAKGIPTADCPVARMNSVLFRQVVEGVMDIRTLPSGDVAWENTDDAWIRQYGNELLNLIG